MNTFIFALPRKYFRKYPMLAFSQNLMFLWDIAKVNEESSHLLAFGPPLGRYHFKRLPYGIHSASKVFQQEITSIISGIRVVLTPKI